MLRAEVELEGYGRTALIDIGCSFTVVSVAVAREVGCVWTSNVGIVLETFERPVRMLGSCWVRLLVCGGAKLGPHEVQVMQTLPLDVSLVVGFDIVLEHGVVLTPWEGSVKVEFGQRAMGQTSLLGGHRPSGVQRAEADDDFEAWFEAGSWTMTWEMKGGWPTRFSAWCQSMTRLNLWPRSEWVADGILVPWSEANHGVIQNIILLMSVKQMKGSQCKVRPVLYFCELNKCILSLSSDVPTCEERLREWWLLGLRGTLIDLKRAYLQVRVARELWVHQAVRWGGQVYPAHSFGFLGWVQCQR